MAAEVTETTRLYARCVADDRRRVAGAVGAHLVKRHRYEPHWEKKPAHVAALRARHALRAAALRRPARALRPDWIRSRRARSSSARRWSRATTRPARRSSRTTAGWSREIEQLEHKSRRPDVLVDDELIYAFYDSLIPEGIHNGADFERWRARGRERAIRSCCFLKREDLMRHEAAGITTEQFPHQLEMAGRSFASTTTTSPALRATA